MGKRRCIKYALLHCRLFLFSTRPIPDGTGWIYSVWSLILAATQRHSIRSRQLNPFKTRSKKLFLFTMKHLSAARLILGFVNSQICLSHFFAKIRCWYGAISSPEQPEREAGKTRNVHCENSAPAAASDVWKNKGGSRNYDVLKLKIRG